ncbi:hypothetical protein, partial [Micromonospora sp. NPDC005220]|uniref:NADPH-dependent F420 reductase n=1 Tax=Micromonospora sp. NPDC005220 TaxID=3155589 RepID=UPI00339EA5D0
PFNVVFMGCGRLGVADPPRAAAARFCLVIAGRTPGAAAAATAGVPGAFAADIRVVLERASLVVLAVPLGAARRVLTETSVPGRGRPLLDVTNPALGGEEVPPDSSGAHLIAAVAPGWHVIKALNTVPAVMVGEPLCGGLPVSLPLAGDDAGAKAITGALLSRLGFVPLDVGGLEHARELESLAMLLQAVNQRHGVHGRIGLHICGPDGPVPSLHTPAAPGVRLP